MPARFTLCLLLSLAALLGWADEVRIVTWNVREGLSPDHIRRRAAEFRRAGQALRPDVLLLQEVTSRAVAEAIRDAMGLRGYKVACTDFNPGDEADFEHLEVAIVSRFPLDQVLEYDPTPDARGLPGAPPELALNPAAKLGLPRPETPGRGFLWARLSALRLTVAVVHLKSSRGAGPSAEDMANAREREYVAAAVAACVVEDLAQWPGTTCLVGGDFNVGYADAAKVGVDPLRDHLVAGPGQDGYDDTHALLGGGLVGGLRMTHLLAHTREPTFPAFRGSAIDNFYVAGASAQQFAPATIVSDTFGSDHRPVLTVFRTAIHPVEPAPEVVTSAPTAPPRQAIVPAAEARRYLDTEATVELRVAASTLLADKRICFLNSQQDRSRPDNFTVVFMAEGLASLAAAGIADPAAHYRGKTVRVTGRIGLHRDTVQIVVTRADQLTIVR